jgi:hypothetical protein
MKKHKLKAATRIGFFEVYSNFQAYAKECGLTIVNAEFRMDDTPLGSYKATIWTKPKGEETK